jgi:ligand-binding sensor domain-containing protein
MKGYWTLLYVLFYQQAISQDFHFRQEPVLVIEDVRQINRIFQADDQMIWVGTDKGVFWYDGRRYRLEPRTDHQLNKVTSIAQSGSGQIWAGYEDGFLQTINLQGNKQQLKSDSLQGAVISQIVFSASDQMFITTYGKGVWTLDDGMLKRLQFSELARLDDVYDALFDKQGRLWLATDNGIWIYQSQPRESLSHLHKQQGLQDEIVTQLEMADGGDISIGLYDHGLSNYNSEMDSVFALMSLPPSSGNVKGLSKGRHGEIWIGTEKSILRYMAKEGSSTVKLPAELNDRIESILYDVNGNLWVSSGNRIFIANTRIEFTAPGITGIQAIAVSNDMIWIGTETGLYGLNRSDGRVSRFIQNEKINILSLYTDPSGHIWIGTFGQGLYCFDPRSKRHLHLTERDGISNNSILNLDGQGQTIWLATLGGISEIQWKGSPFTSDITIIGFYEKFKFPEGYVYDVFAGVDGKIWFGTDGEGLYLLENGDFRSIKFSMDTMDSLDIPKTVYSITNGEGNSIWISGAKGQILHLDNNGKILDKIQGNQGLIKSLITSGKDEILMIREGGILVRAKSGQLNLYTESSGLKSFTPTINASVKEADGSVWIADKNKILHYIPAEADVDQQVRMYLRAITPISLRSTDIVRLKPDSNFIDVRYTGLWYQDPASVRYRFILRGHDQDWIYTQDLRAVYSSLSPGEYTFVVEGSHNDDFSNAHSITRHFIVIPPFYFRWWFVAGISLFITWMTYTYIMARIKRLQKIHELEKEKTMLRLHAIQAQVNPHFLFNSFNTLSGIIEEDQVAAVDYVDQLSGFFRGVLTHRNAELIRVEEEMELVRNYTYILQKRYGSNLRILEKIDQLSGWIAPLSIQLLVENAIKHNTVSAEKPLAINIHIDADWVTVSNPEQPKINPSTESTGFGLSSLIARYQYLTKIKIEIRREHNTFTVRIPIIQNEKPI